MLTCMCSQLWHNSKTYMLNKNTDTDSASTALSRFEYLHLYKSKCLLTRFIFILFIKIFIKICIFIKLRLLLIQSRKGSVGILTPLHIHLIFRPEVLYCLSRHFFQLPVFFEPLNRLLDLLFTYFLPYTYLLVT